MGVVRPASLKIGQKELHLPAFFPSVSSVKTSLTPSEYIQMLASLSGLNGQFLVSAYDLAGLSVDDPAVKRLSDAEQTGSIVLMDSGNYESFWRGDQLAWTVSKYHNALRANAFDLAFSFDDQAPPTDFDTHVSQIEKGWRQDQNVSESRLIVPIVHGSTSDLAKRCFNVAQATGVNFIAVAERNLGDGIVARAELVKAIRNELDKSGRYIAVHLLGTGNPISIALYSIVGADSFDGLEWCHTVVDHDTALLSHLSHADFFAKQTDWIDAQLPFQARTLAHNLEFYDSWMARLRSAILQNKTTDFCKFNFPDRIFRKCVEVFGWR